MSPGNIAAKTGAWFHRAVILRLLNLIHTASGRALRNRLDMEWKTRALADFSDWLDGLDQVPPEFLPQDPADQSETDNRSVPKDTGSLDGPDLYTLLTEFISLKKQVQIQTREQSRNLQGLKDFNTFAGEGRQILDDLARQVSRMGAMKDKLREETTADILQAFLDIRDSLARGTAARTRVTAPFVRQKKMHALLDGYQIALNKFDQALLRLETTPIPATGQPFDPDTMTAVDTCHVPDMPQGVVTQEISGGFMRRDKVLRHARVVVNTPGKEN
ncbi:MAG: nucleotide exchange factor GrpE [Desulfotignum sp.]|nr:nucleotide exchange factor GrpE [Desulfotignum sp.]MCF8138950.1 nucleotide exchange factor GrpE [Desulfotignum sp.]